MDEALKGPKKKKRKKNDHDLERMDDETVENLRLAMLEAAKCDTESIEAGQPATHKLAMVEEVRDLLNRQNLLSVAVDCGILKGIRRWLEPLPNKSLPAYNVQKLMFEILAKLKPDIVHLTESGIGKIVMFYTKDARPERHIKREAEKLVRDWSRPILGRSDDYHSRDVPVADGSRSFARYFFTFFSPQKTFTNISSFVPAPPPPSRPRKTSADETNNPLAAPVRNTGRARAMMPSSQSYDVAPKSRAEPGRSQFSRPITAQGDDFIRKMKAKKAKKGGKFFG
jgi:transcription factor SPN1